MKILALSNRIPALGRKGDQVVSFHRLMYLVKKGHSVELVCFANLNDSDDYHARSILQSAGIAVNFVSPSRLEIIINVIRALLMRKLPFQCAIYKSKTFSNAVKNFVEVFKPDAIYCVMIRIVENALFYPGPLFIEMVDSMGLNFSRRATNSTYPICLFFGMEGRRVEAYERALAERASLSFVVSDIDRKFICNNKVEAIPLGVDFECFNKSSHNNSALTIAFTGNMSYQPNVDAVLWFYYRCWPLLRAIFPDIHLVVAGNNPHPSVTRLGKRDCSVTVTGQVPSISDILKTATISIAPMQSGSGMQNKILEAMACGVPVVTTSLGLGDLKCEVGKEVLVGDTPNEFVYESALLLSRSDLRNQIGDAGLVYVRRNHSWDILNARFEQAIHSKIKNYKLPLPQ